MFTRPSTSTTQRVPSCSPQPPLAACPQCEQQYQGDYSVPERPPQPGIPLDELPLFAPLYIVEADGTHRAVPRPHLGLYGDDQVGRLGGMGLMAAGAGHVG